MRLGINERFISGKEWFVAAPKNRFCDGNDFDAICVCVCVYFVFVYLPWSVLQIKCTCC